MIAEGLYNQAISEAKDSLNFDTVKVLKIYGELINKMDKR